MVRQIGSDPVDQLADIRRGQPARRLILASHRGPTEYHLTKSGQLHGRDGSGGLVTALIGLSSLADFTWVSAAMTEGDRLVAQARALDGAIKPGAKHRFVVVPKDVYSLHYSVFSNPILWFLQHSLWSTLKRRNLPGLMRRAWIGGYVPTNRAFAKAIAEEVSNASHPPYVMFQDYHLYMAPSNLREFAPHAILQHFVHIPWPTPVLWREVPADFAGAICRSLLSNDIVGFQTRASADNFLRTCEAYVSFASVDRSTSSLQWRGHHTKVKVYPISIDVAGLKKRMASSVVLRYRKRLSKITSRYTIVKVDRVDPMKNILAGFDAFDLVLRQHPELLGEIKLLAFLVPSRLSIHEYKEYTAQVRRKIGEINSRYATGGWRPIESFEENNYEQALAGMSLYDVLLVNSIADGMNLVSKEGPIVNERDGVVVLSKTTGSYSELRDGVIAIDPGDVEETAGALWRGLRMPAEERRNRSLRLRRTIEERDLKAWLRHQLEDLDSVARERTAITPAAAGSERLPLISA